MKKNTLRVLIFSALYCCSLCKEDDKTKCFQKNHVSKFEYIIYNDTNFSKKLKCSEKYLVNSDELLKTPECFGAGKLTLQFLSEKKRVVATKTTQVYCVETRKFKKNITKFLNQNENTLRFMTQQYDQSSDVKLTYRKFYHYNCVNYGTAFCPKKDCTIETYHEFYPEELNSEQADFVSHLSGKKRLKELAAANHFKYFPGRAIFPARLRSSLFSDTFRNITRVNVITKCGTAIAKLITLTMLINKIKKTFDYVEPQQRVNSKFINRKLELGRQKPLQKLLCDGEKRQCRTEPFDVIWRGKHGLVFHSNSQAQGSIVVLPDCSLMFRHVRMADKGAYKCFVRTKGKRGRYPTQAKTVYIIIVAHGLSKQINKRVFFAYQYLLFCWYAVIAVAWLLLKIIQYLIRLRYYYVAIHRQEIINQLKAKKKK